MAFVPTKRFFLAAVVLLYVLGGFVPRAQALTVQQMYAMAKLDDAQRQALAKGKAVGFLLTWPQFFPGALKYDDHSAQVCADFFNAFNAQAVIVNVNHATDELDKVPQVALDAFHSPAEGGHAPCLCLINPTFTKLITIIPLWKTNAERDELFRKAKALVADKNKWLDAATPAPTSLANPSNKVPGTGLVPKPMGR